MASGADSDSREALAASHSDATAPEEDDEQLSIDSLDTTLTALQLQAAEVSGQVQRLASSCQQRQQQYSALSEQYVALLAAAVDSYADDVAALCDASQQLLDGCDAIEQELHDSRRVETLVGKVRRQVLDTEAFVASLLKDTER